MGNETKDKYTKNAISVIKSILDVISVIWVAFCLLSMVIIIIASSKSIGKLVGFLFFSAIASPAIIYILKRRKTKNTKQKQVDKDNENLVNTEVLSERKYNTRQRFDLSTYLKKKKKFILTLSLIIVAIVGFLNINFLGIVKSINVTNVTVNKDTSDLNDRIKLDVEIQGLGNYFIEEASIYKKEDWNKKSYAEKNYVEGYNLTAVTGKTPFYNTINEKVSTSLNKKLYNSFSNTSDIEGEYVLVVKSKMNEVVSNPFTISKTIVDDLVLAGKMQEERSVEARKETSIREQKEAEEAAAKQKAAELEREQIEKNRYQKISDDGFTKVWKVYVEAGRTLRIYGTAGSKLGIAVKSESGDLLYSNLVSAGQYNELVSPSNQYNGYYTVELDYNNNYKYDINFGVQ